MLLLAFLCGVLIPSTYGSISGSTKSSMNDGSEVSVHIDGNNMEFVLKGPADRWFSFGFGNQKMQDTYAIIVHGDSITEHKLDMKSTSQANTVLPRGMLAINSDVTKDEIRTVSLSSSMSKLGDIFKE